MLDNDSIAQEWGIYDWKSQKKCLARSVDTNTPEYLAYDSTTMEYINKWEGEGKRYYYLWEYNIPYLPDYAVETFVHQATRMTLPGANDLEFAFAVSTHKLNQNKKILNVTSKWGQKNHFNDGLISWWSGEQPPAGCGPVAMGQIMRYYNWPNNYDWNKMEDEVPTNETRRLLNDIGIKAGTVYSVDRGTASTSANGVKRAFGKMGYSFKKVNHDLKSVENSLKNNCLVLMGGEDVKHGGHMWVCDGYNYQSESISYALMVLVRNPDGKLSYEQVDYYGCSVNLVMGYHMNWGFYGNANGWYKDYNTQISIGNEIRNYYKNRIDFVEIKPNK